MHILIEKIEVDITLKAFIHVKITAGYIKYKNITQIEE